MKPPLRPRVFARLASWPIHAIENAPPNTLIPTTNPKAFSAFTWTLYTLSLHLCRYLSHQRYLFRSVSLSKRIYVFSLMTNRGRSHASLSSNPGTILSASNTINQCMMRTFLFFLRFGLGGLFWAPCYWVECWVVIYLHVCTCKWQKGEKNPRNNST